VGDRVRRPEDDDRATRSSHPPLSHPRNRKRQLPLQKQLGESRQTHQGESPELDERLTPKPSLSRVSSRWKSRVKSQRKSTPRPRGQALRLIGKALDEACGALDEEQAQALIIAKEALFDRHPCHTLGYEPARRKAERAKHEAALKLRQRAEAEAKRQESIRQLPSDAAPALSWQPTQSRR
jgi:hypothetical protein